MSIIVIIGIVIAIVVGLIVIVLVFFIFLGFRDEENIDEQKMDKNEIILITRIMPVLSAIEKNEEIGAMEANACCDFKPVRSKLYETLLEMDKLKCFPEEFNNLQSLAESGLAASLMHPHSLHSQADEIEFVRSVEDDNGTYFLFRYKTNEPHWAADKGWMAGIAGPYFQIDDRIYQGDTFSSMAPLDSFSAEEHLSIHQQQFAAGV